MRKRIAAAALALLLALPPVAALADENLEELNLDQELPPAVQVLAVDSTSIPAKSAILMEQHSGEVLFESNPDEQLPPASVTKVMTLLLVMEALDSGKITLQDAVTASEYAVSMGGSQIWLKVGEQMTVDELLRAVAIASANDASVALAEYVAGSEEAFLQAMNARAAELGMVNTTFLNCTGLDEEGHLTTARDIALMSRALMEYPLIGEYSTIWMDTLRGGDTELVNTNRLVRFYNGATGLKTGTTSGAGSCLSATATRDDLSLIAVVMGCATSDDRFASARGLLDYGFANYMSLTPPPVDHLLTPVKVIHGTGQYVMPVYDPPGTFVVEKISEDAIQQQVTLVEDVKAPVEAGQVLGKVEITVDGRAVGSYPLKAGSDVESMTFLNALKTLTLALLNMNRPVVEAAPLPLTPETETPPEGQEPGAEQAEESESTPEAQEYPAEGESEATMGIIVEDDTEVTVAWAENEDEETLETVTVAEAENDDDPEADAEDGE